MVLLLELEHQVESEKNPVLKVFLRQLAGPLLEAVTQSQQAQRQLPWS